MANAQTNKVKRRRGRPFRPVELLIDFRVSVSFPSSRELELRRCANAEGLNMSAFIRQILLRELDKRLAS